MQDSLYNITRLIDKDNRNKYMYFASNFNKYNYRVITNAELSINGANLDLPIFVKNFIKENQEVLLIFNVILNSVRGILLRAIDKKEFCNYGFGKGMLYGIGDLDPQFKYGDALILVEGSIDRDVCATFISKNCLGILTSRLSKNQVEVVSRLTNKVILLLDNDEAGIEGESNIKRKLLEKGVQVETFDIKAPDIKDLGDLVDFYRYQNPRFNDIITLYRYKISQLGGKLC